MAEINKQGMAASPQATGGGMQQDPAMQQNSKMPPIAAALIAVQAARQQVGQNAAPQNEPHHSVETQPRSTSVLDEEKLREPQKYAVDREDSNVKKSILQQQAVQGASVSSIPTAVQQRSTVASPKPKAEEATAMQAEKEQPSKGIVPHNTTAFFQSVTPAGTEEQEESNLIPVRSGLQPMRKQKAVFQAAEVGTQAQAEPRMSAKQNLRSQSMQRKKSVTRDKVYAEGEVQNDEDDDEEKAHINGVALLAAITAIVLIVSGLTVFFMLDQFLFGKFADIEMPNFNGLNVSDIQYNEAYKSFNIKYEEVYTDERAVGVVVSQTPRTPRQVKENASVTLYVSAGKRMVQVPNITKMTREDAKMAIQDAGLSVIFKPVSDATAVPDTVLNSVPAAGSQVADGETVQVYFARNDVATKLEVPECVGMASLNEAIAVLAKAGIGYELSPESIGDGTITAQEPIAGELVPRGTSVVLTVSSSVATGLDALPEKQITGADGHVHEYAPSTVVASNEYSIGYTIYACSVCNYFYYDDYTAPSAG